MDSLVGSRHVHACHSSAARGAGAAHRLGLDAVLVPAAEPRAGQQVAAAAPTAKTPLPALHPGLTRLFGVVVPPGRGDAR